MHQRGRPTGTDGSDFSYRMVVDNRYTKVAHGKSQLSKLIFAQAICQLLVAAIIALSTMSLKDVRLYQFGIFSVMLGFISLIIGELGRKRSKVNFLKLFYVGSSISSLISYGLIIHHLRLLEALKDLSNLVNLKFELCAIVTILLNFPIQVKTVTTTILLISNMKPPKKAS